MAVSLTYPYSNHQMLLLPPLRCGASWHSLSVSLSAVGVDQVQHNCDSSHTMVECGAHEKEDQEGFDVFEERIQESHMSSIVALPASFAEAILSRLPSS